MSKGNDPPVVRVTGDGGGRTVRETAMNNLGSTIDPEDVVAADAAAREFVQRHRDDDPVAAPVDEIGRALVVVIDDRAAHGERPSPLGPLVRELLAEAGFHVDATVTVPGDEIEIRNAVNTAVIGGIDLVVSVGGVGVGARDVAPEATEPLLDRRLRGIEEAVRSSGLAAGATDGGLSRGLAGLSGQTLVVNIASSRAAVRDGMATVAPLAKYVIESISEF
ncbi:molybdenum cofactor biosynthesis protein [Gordonia amarae]|uniref:Molybdenum cofactor biosynthesis protein n=3 Tax=Gordonia amarae TaxID=36821 RepID=A0A857L1J8_9ACTN|nr:molybdenum cofactor synthesis domain-containing protein [Gordonia amarae]GAB04037.1 putative molybdenum cofactor biosynthesis protein [Gordonia amarae NBRC 15530]QHN18760.1 molybdenum cofactor biosynthesis protein [Gordonia amarae]QHN23235.1 molybdenum cofactor biosynthesis protein [Gordonia amarae]QHN32137.1 molybdenum cofactor biosynthesis protein [Gordonia amarae]